MPDQPTEDAPDASAAQRSATRAELRGRGGASSAEMRTVAAGGDAGTDAGGSAGPHGNPQADTMPADTTTSPGAADSDPRAALAALGFVDPGPLAPIAGSGAAPADVDADALAGTWPGTARTHTAHAEDTTDAPGTPRADGARPRGGHAHHVARTDWRLGGRTVRRWREWLLAVAFISLGVGVMAGALLAWLVPAAAAAASVLIWAGMIFAIAWAFTRSRPAGLLKLRALDVLYAVALGGAVRIAQGWLDAATGAGSAWPSYPTVGGSLTSLWALTDVVAPVVVAPLVEEFFFRAVVLIAVYTMLRRVFGGVAAGITAVVVSTIVFVLTHALVAGMTAGQLASLTLLGLVNALLVVLTGRIWGAVGVHAVFNASYVALALVGTVVA